jgi:2-polyprenyl-6-methoxyphenol hydroxylase-like FAD-dependent oxidoreductase
MPTRATKRGAHRTPLTRDCDVLICGASFAGLTLARELEDTGARPLIIDRYEIGERQTSACAAPTEGLEQLGLRDSILQTFGEVVVHTSSSTVRWPLPSTFSTFDYRSLCGLLREGSPSSEFETATVEGIETGPVHVVHTAASCARRWSSTRSAGGGCSRTPRRSSRRRRASHAA